MSKKSIKKRIKSSGLISEMGQLGFTLGPSGMWFYRLRGEFIDAVFLQSLAGGKGLRIHVFSVIPDIISYPMRDFPHEFDSKVGNVSRKYLTRRGIAYGGHAWPTDTELELEDSVSGITRLAKSDLLPWFNKIDTRRALYETIHEDVKEDNGEYSDRLREMLLR